MVRVKRGTIARKRRKNLLKHTKGFRYGRKSKYRLSKEALLHAWTNAFKDRKIKKRENRKLWQVKINAALKAEGLKYNKFIKDLKDKKIILDRKVLAELAEKHPALFKKILENIQ
ncbi:MAG: 50S ribosomal protein L20 [Candidatus Pacebacteria bacterium]|jgi:large subunit ribosomal protein L20|nr:50S ribosomal protein L20 [Candidatus Paceibacterota bacterium]MDD5722080.1 50S ribosomal protein L20 [Candidatus Paceibacterota bacterium]